MRSLAFPEFYPPLKSEVEQQPKGNVDGREDEEEESFHGAILAKPSPEARAPRFRRRFLLP